MAIKDGDAIRFSPKYFPDSWTDTITGTIKITDNDRQVIDGLVLIRSDGMPTYHLASVVDDMDFGITWIVRGTDHLSNTAKHLVLWNALNYVWGNKPLPLFTHVGLITERGKKVSKRDGSASLLNYRDQGIDPNALCNWLLRLGWGPVIDDKTTKTISRERAIELFLNAGNMRSSPSNMDLALLASLDRKYKGRKEREARGL